MRRRETDVGTRTVRSYTTTTTEKIMKLTKKQRRAKKLKNREKTVLVNLHKMAIRSELMQWFDQLDWANYSDGDEIIEYENGVERVLN